MTPNWLWGGVQRGGRAPVKKKQLLNLIVELRNEKKWRASTADRGFYQNWDSFGISFLHISETKTGYNLSKVFLDPETNQYFWKSLHVFFLLPEWKQLSWHWVQHVFRACWNTVLVLHKRYKQKNENSAYFFIRTCWKNALLEALPCRGAASPETERKRRMSIESEGEG